MSKRPCESDERPIRNNGGNVVWPCVSWAISSSSSSSLSALALAQWPWTEIISTKPYVREVSLYSYLLPYNAFFFRPSSSRRYVTKIDLDHVTFKPKRLQVSFSAARSLDLNWKSNLVLTLNGHEIDVPSTAKPKNLNTYDSETISNMLQDRHFYKISNVEIPHGGKELNLEIRSLDDKKRTLLCHVYAFVYDSIHHEKEDSSNHHHHHLGTFPIFDSDGKVVGYRPTDHDCIMRDMTKSTYCPVCKAAMMRKMLSITTKKSSYSHGRGGGGADFLISESNTSISYSFELMLVSEILLFVIFLAYYVREHPRYKYSATLIMSTIFAFAIFVPTLLLGALMKAEEHNTKSISIRGAHVSSSAHSTPPISTIQHYDHHRSWVGLTKDENDVTQRCRTTPSSQNGIVVDDMGFRCMFDHVQADGCCGGSSSHEYLKKRYDCESCENDDDGVRNPSRHCCDAYENCVSCCMGSKYSSTDLPHGVAFCALLNDESFEFCSCRCRTHSGHLKHENSYKSKLHFCFDSNENN